MRPSEGNLAAARSGTLLRFRTKIEGRRVRLSIGILAAASLLGALAAPAMSGSPASAGTIQTLQQQAAALTTQINAAYTHLSVLDEAYDQAETRISELATSIHVQNQAIAADQKKLGDDTDRLRDIAIDAYVNGQSGGIGVFFNGTQQQMPMQQAYLSAASGNLDEAVSSVQTDHHALSVHRQALVKAEASEVTTKQQISNDISQAKSVTASLESTLSSIKGQLAAAVAAQERAIQEQQAAAAAAQARKQQEEAAAAAAASQPPPPPPPPTVIQPSGGGGGGGGTVTGGGSGAVAVRAAESQLGVPYVWGGATPGVGFDCSGLTMWAWGQAGVSLAHGATDQYYEIAHVSLSDLAPGDLIFYGDASYLYHVVMYIGGGMVIQAEMTGTNVMETPIPPGPYGAGQP